MHITTDAVEDERGLVRQTRGVLDAHARHLAGIVLVVPAAVPLYDGEGSVFRYFRYGSVPGHEASQIVLPRVAVVNAQNSELVPVNRGGGISLHLVKPIQDRRRDAGELPGRGEHPRRRLRLCCSEGAPV